MPQFRKVAATEATRWRRPRPARTRYARPKRTNAQAPAGLAQLLGELADRSGLTRLDRSGNAGGEHAWRARVYARGVELHKQFADALYGGPAGALRAAVAWRDSMREIAKRAPARATRIGRVVRAEYKRMCGWIAYGVYTKRYFADGAHGGRDAAEATARAWLQQEKACAK